jgi:hypothetical protein
MNKQEIWEGLKVELAQFVGEKNTEQTQSAMARMARAWLIANADITDMSPNSIDVIQCAKDRTFIHICSGGQVPDDGCRP